MVTFREGVRNAAIGTAVVVGVWIGGNYQFNAPRGVYNWKTYTAATNVDPRTGLITGGTIEGGYTGGDPDGPLNNGFFPGIRRYGRMTINVPRENIFTGYSLPRRALIRMREDYFQSPNDDGSYPLGGGFQVLRPLNSDGTTETVTVPVLPGNKMEKGGHLWEYDGSNWKDMGPISVIPSPSSPTAPAQVVAKQENVLEEMQRYQTRTSPVSGSQELASSLYIDLARRTTPGEYGDALRAMGTQRL